MNLLEKYREAKKKLCVFLGVFIVKRHKNYEDVKILAA